MSDPSVALDEVKPAPTEIVASAVAYLIITTPEPPLPPLLPSGGLYPPALPVQPALWSPPAPPPEPGCVSHICPKVPYSPLPLVPP